MELDDKIYKKIIKLTDEGNDRSRWYIKCY